MKRYLNVFATMLMGIFMLSSCDKDENKVYYNGGTAPVLTASSTAAMILLPANAANPGMKFTWTNPNYQFTTGVSSQDVSYSLQADTTGSNFRNPTETSISKDLSITLTVKDFNSVFSRMNLLENIPHNVEFRIKSSLANNSLPLYSNVIKMVVTPYLDVVVPIPVNGTLWATGDAFPSGYANPLGNPYDANQKFIKVSNTLYELTVAMPGGGAYKLIQVQSDWSMQYHMLTGGSWNSGSFEKKDSDPGFPGPPSAGTYKISVNFKTGIYTVTKQ